MTRKLAPTLALCLLIVLTAATSTPVGADVSQAVAEHIENERRGRGTPYDKIKAEPPAQVLAELRKYLRDPADGARLEVVGLASVVGSKHPQRGVQQQAARLVLDVALGDADYGVRDFALSRLHRFFSHDAFKDDMRRDIHRALQQKNLNGYLVQVAGIAEVRSAAPRLRQLANAGSWSAQLALARMGDPMAIRYVIDRVEGSKDEVRRVRSLLDSLAYIRQPEAVEVIIKYLFSDKSTPASPPDVGSVPYSYYAVRLLEEIIEGFPTGIANTEAGIVRARQWITQQLAPQPAAAAGQPAPATAQATRSGGVANLKIKR